MNKPGIWVVEMLDNGEWEPTVGVSLGREPGREVLKDWQERNPDDKFRLVRYSPFTTSALHKEGK